MNNQDMTLSQELIWRGMINQTTLADTTQLDTQKITFYHGFDASAPSQTVGNLAAMMVDLVFLRHGHKAIILAGGATSLIGDPGGKDKERPMQSVETINDNVSRAEKQIQKIYAGHSITCVNNLDWTKNLSVLEFLRDIGKHYTVGDMIKKDYIKDRISGDGISYTEFSYALLQGYDYLHLFDMYDCTLQIGGSDQWANCLSGVELVRRKRGREVHVLTLPLVINRATGKKFGKSEAGAVWLDPDMTSPYDFYQFWLNVDDESVLEYLKIFTPILPKEYEAIVTEFQKDKSKRLAQKYLAYETTLLVHGKIEAEKAKQTSESLFDKKEIPDNIPTYELVNNLVDTMIHNNVITSRSEYTRLAKGRGLRDVTQDYTIEHDALAYVPEKGTVIKVGKKIFFKIV